MPELTDRLSIARNDDGSRMEVLGEAYGPLAITDIGISRPAYTITHTESGTKLPFPVTGDLMKAEEYLLTALAMDVNWALPADELRSRYPWVPGHLNARYAGPERPDNA